MLQTATHQQDMMDSTEKKSEFDHFLALAEVAATAAGELLVERMGKVDIREKQPGDFVTQADVDSQTLIERIILDQFPKHAFLGEEQSAHTAAAGLNFNSEYCWIVDPLDGTTNYIHQLRSFGVSIALRHREEMVVGCVHDPILAETYTAVSGGGARLNGLPITPSRIVRSDQALLAVSLPQNLARDSRELRQLNNVLVDTHATVRRLGSAALNLCYVACGRLDGYWATSTKVWDLAAGTLILLEAGGSIRHIDGQAFDWNDPQFVATGTQALYENLRGCFSVK